MLYLFLIFLVFFGFSLYSRQFNNPFKLTFIFGKKGAGKSLYMCKTMLKYLKKGWYVYTDIPDVNIPGVRMFDAKDLADFRPEFNSALFLDEVGISFDNRNYKSFPSGLRDFYKLQRKYKCVVYMNSQSFDVDKKIRDVVDSMILQSSIGNVFSISRPILRTVTLTEPSSEAESRIADKLKFAPIWRWKVTFMPRYFKWFNSFSAPERPLISFSTIPGDLNDFKKKPIDILKGLRKKHV